jgi:hypothetical protein
MRRVSHPNYVAFRPAETIVTFATDRGQLRTNDTGDFFFREFTNGKFTCASPDLERQLINAGVRAGFLVGITRSTFNRAVIWKVRIIAPVAKMPGTIPAATNGKPNGLPERLYAKVEPPAPVWDGLAVNLPAVNEAGRSKNASSAAGALFVGNGAHTETITGGDGGLLGRCLSEALNAARVAQAHAAAIGLSMLFGAGEVERMAVSIFIERTRYGSVVDRKPNGSAGYQTGPTGARA